MIKLSEKPPSRSLFLPILSEDSSLFRVISPAVFPQICWAAGRVHCFMYLFLPMWADFSDLQQRLMPLQPRGLNSATIFCVALYENASESPNKYQFVWINQCWEVLKQLFSSFKLSLQSASQLCLHETKTITPRTTTTDNIGEMYRSRSRSQQWHQGLKAKM